MKSEIKDWLLDNGFYKWVGDNKFEISYLHGMVQVTDGVVWLGGDESVIDTHGLSLKFESLNDLKEIMNVINKFAK